MTAKSTQVHKRILYVFRSMQMFGLCQIPISLESKSSTSQRTTETIWFGICGVHLVLGVFYVYAMVVETSVLAIENQTTSSYLDMVTFLTLGSTYFLIYLECYQKRDQLRAFLQIHERFRKKYCSHEEEQLYRRFSQIYLVGMLGYFSCVVYFTLRIIDIYGSLKVYFFGYIPSNILLFLRLIQIMGFIELLEIAVNFLRRKAKSFRTIFSLEDVQDFAEDYNSLFEMAEHMKEATSLSLKCIYLHTCVKLVSSLYWVVLEQIFKIGPTEYISVLLNIFVLFMFLKVCDNFKKNMNCLMSSVFGIPQDLLGWEKSLRINCLILQMKHQSIVLDGNGLFELNLNLFKSLMANFGSYAMFFFQTLDKFETLPFEEDFE